VPVRHRLGPYRIKPELFDRARCQAQRLACGEVQYKTIDYRYNTRHVCNCIHALTRFNDRRRLRAASPPTVTTSR
jgi:hypothetical protein